VEIVDVVFLKEVVVDVVNVVNKEEKNNVVEIV